MRNHDNEQIFVTRPPVWARWIAVGPLIFAAAIIVVLTLSRRPDATGIAAAVLAVIVLALVALGWIIWTALQVRVTDTEVTLGAPFYRTHIATAEIYSIEVVDDSPLTHSGFDWVVMGRARRPNGVRLSLGGPSALQLRADGGRLYTVVFDSTDGANLAAQAVRRAVAADEPPLI